MFSLFQYEFVQNAFLGGTIIAIVAGVVGYFVVLRAQAFAAEALTDILVCVADRHEAAARFGRFAGRAPREEGRLSLVPLDRGRLVFAEAGFVTAIANFTLPNVPAMVGQAIRCADLDGLRALLGRAHIRPLADNGLVVCVAAADALGSLLLFHDAAVASPWPALAA